MKMMVSEDITHDDDQLSTKTIQDHEDDGIMEKESLFEDITHDDEDDGIMEKESLFEDITHDDDQLSTKIDSRSRR